MARSRSIDRILSAPVAPRWIIGVVLGAIWLAGSVSRLGYGCSVGSPCKTLVDAAGTPYFFVFPYVLWLPLFVPTQSHIVAEGVILAICLGLYVVARGVLPARLTIVHVLAVLLVWVALSVAGVGFLFQVSPHLRPPAR